MYVRIRLLRPIRLQNYNNFLDYANITDIECKIYNVKWLLILMKMIDERYLDS